MKKLLSLLLALLVLATSMTALGEARVAYTDSVGREVTLPAQITKIAATGPMTQMALLALAPEMLVGISSKWSDTAVEYLAQQCLSLPVIGQFYGGDMNLEALMSTGAQVVIDVGEAKKTIVEDMDGLTQQTGLPFVHIDMTTATMGAAFRVLGELLGKQEEAERLAAYCDETYARVSAVAQSVEKANILYVTGDKGLNVIAKGSYHAEIIDLLANNLAVVDTPSSKGTGNEVDMEQILLWNPDVIFFSPESVYDTAADDPLYQRVAAIQNGAYYKVPNGPFNWMGFPPSVQRLLGLLWMAKTLYPEAADYDLYEEVSEYFELFYHVELTQEQFNKLIG